MESKTRSRVNNSGGTTSSLGTAAGIRTTIGDEESVDYSGGIPNTGNKMLSHLLTRSYFYIVLLSCSPQNSLLDGFSFINF